jgi:hypothetical protein
MCDRIDTIAVLYEPHGKEEYETVHLFIDPRKLGSGASCEEKINIVRRAHI